MSVLAPKQKRPETKPKAEVRRTQSKKRQAGSPGKAQKNRQRSGGASQQQNALGNRFVAQQAEEKERLKEEAKTKSKEESVDAGLQGVEKTAKKREEHIETDTLSGRDSAEMLSRFSEASASEMAALYPLLGEKVADVLNAEQEREKRALPELQARSGLKSEAEKVEQVKASPEPRSFKEEKVFEKEPPPLQQREEKRETPPPPANQNIDTMLRKRKEKGFFSWLKAHFSSLIAQIKTKDEHLSTSAGSTPSVQMQGKADKRVIERSRSRSQEAVAESKKEVSDILIANPGQRRIKAVKVNEKKKIPLAVAPASPVKTEEDKGMKAYLGIELSEEVRRHADELLAPAIEKSTKLLNERTQKAKREKEQQKRKEMQKGQRELQRLNQKANEAQAKEIEKGRRAVVREQRQGIDEAQKSVAKFNADIKSREKQSSQEVDAAVNKANREAKQTIQEGEKEAKRIKKEKEREAEAKKQALAAKKKKRSLWDRTVDVVKSAVQLVTKAIDRIFTVMRTLVKKAIEKAKNLAIKVINKARAWVVTRLEKFRTWAKSMVDKYLKSYFPNLAKKINRLIDKVVDLSVKVVNKVAETLIKSVELFAKGLGKILDKVLSIYQTALKAAVAMAGAVLTGDFAEALKIAIQAACDIAGVDSKPVFVFFDKAGKLIVKILKDPVSFFKNLVFAVAKGIRRFQKNIVKHLKAGLIGWLTGVLSGTEIELPKKFDFKGILSLAMQILGLTYKNIKARIIKKYPKAEKVFDRLEKGFTLIQEILAGGVVVLWKKIKEKIGDLREMVLSAIRNFVIFSVIKNGVLWLLSLLNPASAIAKVMKLLFDFVMFLVERFTQIKDFVLSVYGSVAAIAAGSLGKAAKAVEGALAKSVPVVISMLAAVIGLGGIGKTIQRLIKKISAPINRVIDKVIDSAVKFAKKLIGRFKGGKKSAKEKRTKKTKSTAGNKASKKQIDKTLGEKMRFSAGKEGHTLWITNVGGKIRVMVASEAGTVAHRLDVWESKLDSLEERKKVMAKSQIDLARNFNRIVLLNALNEQTVTVMVLQDKVLTEAEIKAEKGAEKRTVQAEKALEMVLKVLFDLYGDIDTGKVFDVKLRARAEVLLKDLTRSEPYKQAEEAYRKAHKKGYVDNHIGIIRKKVNAQVGLFLRQGDITIFDKPLLQYMKENLLSKAASEHKKYDPEVTKISIEKGKFVVRYDYDPAGDKKKEFQVFFDFAQVSDMKKGVVIQRTEGTNLKLKPQGTRGKTESSGKLFNQTKLYRDFLTSQGVKLEEQYREDLLKEMVKKIGMEKYRAYVRSKVTIMNNPLLKERADKLKKANLFDSAHIVADWFGGSGYRKALNLTATSAEYNRITMGDAEKSIAQKVKEKNEEALFNLSVESKWDYLEDNEIISVVTKNSMMKKVSTEAKSEKIDARHLAEGAEEALERVLLKKQDPRRVLSISYDAFMQVDESEKLKEQIGCDIWMSSYFDFDKGADTLCNY